MGPTKITRSSTPNFFVNFFVNFHYSFYLRINVFVTFFVTIFRKLPKFESSATEIALVEGFGGFKRVSRVQKRVLRSRSSLFGYIDISVSE